MKLLSEWIFTIDVIFLLFMLAGVMWSVAKPEKRIWPPPRKQSWQFYLTWGCFLVVFTLNAALMVIDWNSWLFTSKLRWVLGVPLSLVGVLLVGWGISKLGTTNTSGIEDGLRKVGPYRFTRNPQYVGDSLLFIGLCIIANSVYLWITHVLLILVFVITPLAEETWLEDQYGDNYLVYKRNTPRFL